ncbi:hypothetical protein pb186bvf_003776 [Paramecium bursaria]
MANELDDIDINYDQMVQNQKLLRNLRAYGAINAGTVSGLFGFDGIVGFAMYFLFFALTSFCMGLNMKFQPQKYFKDRYDVYYSGVFADLQLFLIFWVVFHNLVYIL